MAIACSPKKRQGRFRLWVRCVGYRGSVSRFDQNPYGGAGFPGPDGPYGCGPQAFRRKGQTERLQLLGGVYKCKLPFLCHGMPRGSQKCGQGFRCGKKRCTPGSACGKPSGCAVPERRVHCHDGECGLRDALVFRVLHKVKMQNGEPRRKPQAKSVCLCRLEQVFLHINACCAALRS